MTILNAKVSDSMIRICAFIYLMTVMESFCSHANISVLLSGQNSLNFAKSSGRPPRISVSSLLSGQSNPNPIVTSDKTDTKKDIMQLVGDDGTTTISQNPNYQAAEKVMQNESLFSQFLKAIQQFLISLTVQDGITPQTKTLSPKTTHQSVLNLVSNSSDNGDNQPSQEQTIKHPKPISALIGDAS